MARADRRVSPPPRKPPPKPAAARRFPLPLAQVRGAEGSEKASEAGGDKEGRALFRPQRLVQSAAADAARQRAPQGLGLDSAAVRARMVERLRASGISDARLLAAFGSVERHCFVDSALANQAYEETSLPIGFGQTISKPLIVAQMLQTLLQGLPQQRFRRVLEIGTGCGYQAALLACLADRVVSIERVGGLAERARANLEAAGIRNVQALHGDGRLGAASLGPYDAIVSAAGGVEVPEAWFEQLAAGGRLVAPGTELRPGVQELVVAERGPAGLIRRQGGEVYFVPLKSGAE
jgi:protein-L-isoaspartate(D-aspartate) O-methyltransferase